MRKVVVAMVALAIPFVGAGPASADPARASAAAAFGIQASGLLAIPPTPTVAVSQPPDTGRTVNGNFNSTIPLDLGGLAVTGTVDAVGEAARESRLDAVVQGVQDGNNARGFARTTGLQLLGDSDLVTAIGGDLLGTNGLLTATAIEAEAVARCVNNVPVFDAGFNILGLELAELDLGETLGPLLQQLLQTLNIPGVLEIDTPDTDPGLVAVGPESITITALRIRVLGTLEEINISQASAAMPANCAVEQPGPPTGPGPIAPTLAATGTSDLMLPAALGLLATGFGLRRLNRRHRRANAEA